MEQITDLVFSHHLLHCLPLSGTRGLVQELPILDGVLGAQDEGRTSFHLRLHPAAIAGSHSLAQPTRHNAIMWRGMVRAHGRLRIGARCVQAHDITHIIIRIAGFGDLGGWRGGLELGRILGHVGRPSDGKLAHTGSDHTRRS